MGIAANAGYPGDTGLPHLGMKPAKHLLQVQRSIAMGATALQPIRLMLIKALNLLQQALGQFTQSQLAQLNTI
jgi:hypothetical protein